MAAMILLLGTARFALDFHEGNLAESFVAAFAPSAARHLLNGREVPYCQSAGTSRNQ